VNPPVPASSSGGGKADRVPPVGPGP
jgi:hypothetical protein